MCLKESEGFTYMWSIDFVNITLQACDKLTRIFNWYSVHFSNTSSSSNSFHNTSFASSCSAFSLLISASSVCTSFTSTCNLFPQASSSSIHSLCTRTFMRATFGGESSCVLFAITPVISHLHASFPLAACAFLMKEQGLNRLKHWPRIQGLSAKYLSKCL